MRTSFLPGAGWPALWLIILGAVLAAGCGRPAAELPGHDADGHVHDETCDHDHEEPEAAGHDHDGHAHDRAGGADDDHADHDDDPPPDDHEHDDAATLTLSQQAKANVGLRLAKVELRPFDRTISVPGVVVEPPGRSRVQITAPWTAVVRRIYALEGEAVTPEAPLFDLRLTHEELVQGQADFLQIAEELAVVRQEVERIEKVVAEGAIAGKRLLERQYEQKKLEAALHAFRQRLLLHQLTPQQIDDILKTRTLLRDFTVRVPTVAEGIDAEPLLQIHAFNVEKGQQVTAGQLLCVLTDHTELYLEGKAFQQDIPALSRAMEEDAPVTAVFPSTGGDAGRVEDLHMLYLDSKVEVQSRAFRFFVTLPNKLLRDKTDRQGHRFIDWQFKPGQRVRLMIPVKRYRERIVLPVDAVVRDGAESYVFEHNHGHFDRRSVHVEYRDQDWVVIVNDGSLKPGVEVAISGAYQIHLALKRKGGQDIDPHAGHHH